MVDLGVVMIIIIKKSESWWEETSEEMWGCEGKKVSVWGKSRVGSMKE